MWSILGDRTRSAVASLAPSTTCVADLPVLGLGGAVLGTGSLLQAWLAVPLLPKRGPFDQPIVFAGLPSLPPLNYGAAGASLLVLAVLATIRSRGRRSALAGLAGLGLVMLPLLLLAQLALWDIDGRETLTFQLAARTAVDHQFGYGVGSAPLTSLGLLELPEPWLSIVGLLARGWFLCMLSGLLLLMDERSQLSNAWHRRPRAWSLGLTLGTVTLLFLAGRGVAAELVLQSGTNEVLSGKSEAGVARLQLARSLNPSLSHDRRFEVALGSALQGMGVLSTPPALFSRAVSEPNADRRLQELVEAHRAAPSDPVIGRQLASSLLDDLVSKRLAAADVSGLLAACGVADSAAVEYAAGRALFRSGDYGAARPYFMHVLQLTPDRDVRSSALTYAALCNLHLGEPDTARHQLIAAIALDSGYSNSLARTAAVGLYLGVSP